MGGRLPRTAFRCGEQQGGGCWGLWVVWMRQMLAVLASPSAASPINTRCLWTLCAAAQMNRGEVDEAELKERQARAMADPEVQGILTDPVMRQASGGT